MLGMTQPKEKKYILLVFHWHLLPFNGETIGSIRDRPESDKVTAKWPEKRENHKNQRHHAIEGVFWHWDFFARYRNWKGKPYALASLFFLLCFLHSFSLLRNLHHSKWGNKRCMEKIYNKNGKEYSSCFYWIDNDLKLWLFPFFSLSSFSLLPVAVRDEIHMPVLHLSSKLIIAHFEAKSNLLLGFLRTEISPFHKYSVIDLSWLENALRTQQIAKRKKKSGQTETDRNLHGRK